MISDEQIVSESPFISKKENLKEKELREQIAQFRDELKKSGETYSAIKTAVNLISSKKISDSIISTKIKEETYLTISNTDTATGYDAEHFCTEPMDREKRIRYGISGKQPAGI